MMGISSNQHDMSFSLCNQEDVILPVIASSKLLLSEIPSCNYLMQQSVIALAFYLQSWDVVSCVDFELFHFLMYSELKVPLALKRSQFGVWAPCHYPGLVFMG